VRRFGIASSVVVLVALLVTPQLAGATNGYFSHGIGIKSKGMGGAGLAYPQDALVGGSNPAGFAFIDDRFDIGIDYFRPDRGSEIIGSGAPVNMVYDGNGESAFFMPDAGVRLGLSDITIIEKDSGYASVHYIVRLRESIVPKADRPWMEIQVRTLVEDCWGEIEHVLGYKPNKRTLLAVKDQFRIISSLLSAVDEHFNFLYDQQNKFQAEVDLSENDPLNAENFPKLLKNEIGLNVTQNSIDGLLKILVSRSIATVGQFRSSATKAKKDTIQNYFVSKEGRPPDTWEWVAAFAAASGKSRPDEIQESIEQHMLALNLWRDILGGARTNEE